MTQDNLHIVIMAGGVGSRFWPYSRNSKPKQFLDVLDTGKSLLQLTYDRFKNSAREDNIYVVSNQQYGTIIQEQLPHFSRHQILLEPVRRNTAPCIAYASYKILKKDPKAVIVVTPADHAIFGEEAFLKCITTAAESAASSDKLITLGIKPTRPDTGYGYIQYINEGNSEVKKVKTFTEKPQIDLARKFLESGDFVWNAGIFIWSARSIIKAFELDMPDLAETFSEGEEVYFTQGESSFIGKAYSQSKNISIDYGIMEKAPNVYVVLGDFGWSDLGSWNSLYDIKEKDSNKNVIKANTVLFDSTENIIHGREDKLIILHDIKGYLVADFDDILIVCRKDEEAKFREFVAEVKSQKGEDFL